MHIPRTVRRERSLRRWANTAPSDVGPQHRAPRVSPSQLRSLRLHHLRRPSLTAAAQPSWRP
eukprot:4840567-Pyramimonas_sp.AAC.1